MIDICIKALKTDPRKENDVGRSTATRAYTALNKRSYCSELFYYFSTVILFKHSICFKEQDTHYMGIIK
jgi:hypothetical protein